MIMTDRSKKTLSRRSEMFSKCHMYNTIVLDVTFVYIYIFKFDLSVGKLAKRNSPRKFPWSIFIPIFFSGFAEV